MVVYYKQWRAPKIPEIESPAFFSAADMNCFYKEPQFNYLNVAFNFKHNTKHKTVYVTKYF